MNFLKKYCLLGLMTCNLGYNAAAGKTEIVLPESFDSYRKIENLNYTGRELFDYINGGAELYISYGLVGMTGCKYGGENLPQITVEIYEMTSPANAFGVYTQSRDSEEHAYGQGSQSFPDFIMFWKGRYFVAVNTQDITPESSKGIEFLAGLIDSAITETGQIPAIIDALPHQGLADAGFLYFHHYIWLNSYYFIADYNILNINEQTDAVLAKYGPADRRAYLLLVDYPDEAKADEAFHNMKQKYAPELAENHPFIKLEDKTWFSLWRSGKRLGAIFDGKSEAETETLYNEAIKQ
jgi:hypothetical protein